MKRSYTRLFWLIALGVAVSFDQFFWDKPWGINFFLFILLVVIGGLIPLWLEKTSMPWASYGLLIPMAGFALMTFFRAEALTNVMNVLITLGTLVLFFTTLLNGDWLMFSLQEYVINLFKFIINCFSGGILFFKKVNQEPDDFAAQSKENALKTEAGTDEPAEKRKTRKFLPYIKGFLLAVPILLLLTLLLASADPVFERRIQSLSTWFNLDDMGENIVRFFIIVMLGYVLLSVYYFGFVESRKLKKTESSKPYVSPFLGFIESSIVIGSVNLLFMSFVILQFTYLFGGETNISIEGFTYSEYAVRGFFELVAVVIITIAMFYGLALLTKRKTNTQRWAFSGLGFLLVGLTAVILASAFKRLSLYEAAYGFTRLRTMTHISMVWIGLLLLAIVILEVSRKMERLAFVLICLIFSFGVTVNLVNIDQYIVKENIGRVLSTTENTPDTELDTNYLYSLSYDSIPPLVSFFSDPALPKHIHDEIGGILACRLATLDDSEKLPWYSTHFSRSKAMSLLEKNAGDLERYLTFEGMEWFVEVNSELKPCRDYDVNSIYLD